MNAFQRSAVFAAVLVLLALSAEATPSSTPVNTSVACTFSPVIAGSTTSTVNYNPFTQFCCKTGIVSIANNQDPYVGCCSDRSSEECPGNATQVACCRPAAAAPAWTETDIDFQATKRDCYNKDFQGCCQTTFLFDKYGNSTYRYIPTSAVFDSDTQQCCAASNSLPISTTGTPLTVSNTAQAVIAPKGTTSCIQQLRATGVEFRCYDDSVCPGNAVGRGKCCRRPIGPYESTNDYATNFGRCYDPLYEDCCNSWAGNNSFAQPAIASADVISRQFFQCCKLPTYSGGAAGDQKYAIPVTDRCPCMVTTDCGGANYTCCAPAQTQLQGGNFNSRRLVACPSVGAALSSSGNIFTDNLSRFPGCYGQCLPSGANSAATSLSAKVCLNNLPSFGQNCADLRVENAGAFTGFYAVLTGSQWITPSLTDLIKDESQWHGADCCKSQDGFAALMWQQKDVCCPVMGTTPAAGSFPRRLTPVVPRSAMIDANLASPTTWGGCLCNDNSHCQTGYTCCANGNSWIVGAYTGGAGETDRNKKARQLIYTNANGTAFTGICVDPKTTECCDLKKNDPDTNNKALLSVGQVQPFLAATQVCCAEGGLQSSLGDCGCHNDADCTNGGLAPWGACCAGNNRFGSELHASLGKCYDTRRQSCCKYHTDGSSVPVGDGVLGLAAVYDNTTEVCCPWGGKKNQLSECTCRSDMESTDCGTSAKCCAGLVTGQQSTTTYRQSTGKCYDAAKNQSCCQSRMTAVPVNSIATVYDSTKQVCCAVNGVASDHRSCKCSADSHCPANGQCCTDLQSAAAGARIDCSDFNTPGVTNVIDNAVCPGRCIHKELETCCDNPFTSEWKAQSPVTTCVKDYQKCCDGECCNKAIQSCKKTTRNRYSSASGVSKIATTGALANIRLGLEGSFTPGYHYGMDESAHACTQTEHSSPSIVFHTWVFPAFLSVASIIVVLLGSRAGLTAEVGSNMHRLVLVGVQVFVAIMSMLLLWSPLWKYGFGIIFANSFILHAFVVGGQWTRRFACILMVVTFLWVYEPFGTNSILNFGTVTYGGRGTPTQSASYQIHGLNYAARVLQRPRDDTSTTNDACANFYQYWRVDNNLHDARSWNPQGTTRGICRRSWMHTIVVLAGIIMPFEAVWLFLAAIAFARASQATKDVKVQPIQA